MILIISIPAWSKGSTTYGTLTINQTATDESTKGLNVIQSGEATTNYGTYLDVYGGTNNYAIYVASGETYLKETTIGGGTSVEGIVTSEGLYIGGIDISDTYVDVSGDTMTGDLTTSASIYVDTINENTSENGVIIDGIALENDGTKSWILSPAGDYLRVGDAATTSQGLASEDDLLVTGSLEVDGILYLNGNISPESGILTIEGTTSINILTAESAWIGDLTADTFNYTVTNGSFVDLSVTGTATLPASTLKIVDLYPNLYNFWRFDETSGITAEDTGTATTRSLTAIGTPEWTDGVLRGSTELNQTPTLEYWYYSDNADFEPSTGDFTYGGWYYSTATAGVTNNTLMSKGGDLDANNGMYLFLGQAIGGKLAYWLNGYSADSGDVFPEDEWVFVWIKRASSSVEVGWTEATLEAFDANAILTATVTVSLGVNASDFNIGASAYAGATRYPWEGMIDQSLWIKGYACTDEELEAIYNRGISQGLPLWIQ
jgi:hypothetical protein